MGRSSGGMTGSTSMIIHSGLLPERRKASTTSRRLTMRAFFWPEASFSSARSCSESSSRLMSWSSFFTASAPMAASKSSSYFSRMSRYSFSVRIWFLARGEKPGSVTI